MESAQKDGAVPTTTTTQGVAPRKDQAKYIEELRVVAYQEPNLLVAEELRLVARSEPDKKRRRQLRTVAAVKESEQERTGVVAVSKSLKELRSTQPELLTAVELRYVAAHEVDETRRLEMFALAQSKEKEHEQVSGESPLLWSYGLAITAAKLDAALDDFLSDDSDDDTMEMMMAQLGVLQRLAANEEAMAGHALQM